MYYDGDDDFGCLGSRRFTQYISEILKLDLQHGALSDISVSTVSKPMPTFIARNLQYIVTIQFSNNTDNAAK